MYRLGVRRVFSAAHFLRGYQGSCEALHGHNWTVEVELLSPRLDDVGMAWDFRGIKKTLDEILGELDHRLLNEHPAFADQNPSAENLAAFVYTRLAEQTPAPLHVARVRVWESEGTWAAFEPDHAPDVGL